MCESPKKKVVSLGASRKEKSLPASLLEVLAWVVDRACFFGVEALAPDAPFSSGENLAFRFPVELGGVRAVLGKFVGAFWIAGVHSSSKACLD